jgi:L-amino acid N-acyltransferase YncA
MIQFKRLGPEDVATVRELGAREESFYPHSDEPAFWTKTQLRRWFRSDDGVCLGAFKNGRLIGFALATLHAPTGKATCENVFVAPLSRGKGIGKRLGERLLTKLLEKGARHVMCLTDENNLRSRGLHASLGYRDYGNFRWLGCTLRP